MGISKRNPRGNFNWQTRYLKSKAICCGQLNDYVDCDLNAPVLSIAGTTICIEDPVVPHSMTCTNTKPGQATTTLYEWYKGSIVDPPYYSSYGPTSTLTFATPTSSLEDTWFVKATNEFGCITIEEFQVYAVNSPQFSYSVVYPIQPCSSINSNTGDAEISVTLTNPDPSALYYGYEIIYGNNTLNPGYNYETTSVATTFTWTGLCAGNYIINVNLYRLIDGVLTVLCNVSLNIQTGPLILTWDDIANTSTIGVTDPTNLLQWQLALNAFSIVTVNVVGNQVFLYATDIIILLPYKFINNVNIIGIEDYGRYITILNDGVFYNTSNLSTVVLPYVTTINETTFGLSGPFAASFPNCTFIGNSAFADSAITDIRFEILTDINYFAFENTLSLLLYDFPKVIHAKDKAFKGSGILDISFPLLEIADYQCFNSLPNAVNVNCPNLQTLGDGAMGGNPLMGSAGPVYLPSLQTGGNDCLSTNATLIELDLPSMVTAGAGAFQLNPLCTKINAPNLISLGGFGCRFDDNLAIINFDSIVDIGSTVLDNGVFDASPPPPPVACTIRVPIAQQTADAGSLEGDLVFLSGTRTVTFIWT